MISKEKLKQETEKAIESSENKTKEDFDNSIVLVNEILDVFFAEIKKKRHNKAIEKICTESANKGNTFAKFSLVEDDYFDKKQAYYVLTTGFSSILSLHFMKKHSKQLAFIRDSFKEYFKRFYNRKICIDKLEIENDNYRFGCTKKYSYHGLELSICLRLCAGTIECFVNWSR